MKSIVVDTSVVIKWFFPEIGAEKALKLKDDYLKKKILICSRDLLLFEFTSAFRNYSAVKIKPSDFKLAALALQSMNLKIYPLEYQELSTLFDQSKKLKISIYDCSYILLAKKLRSALYTSDKKLFLASKTILSTFFV